MKCEKSVIVNGEYYCTYHQLMAEHDVYGVVLKKEQSLEELDASSELKNQD